MPCNIGFKTYQEVYLPVPQPKKLTKKVEAPKLNVDLLDKLGETTPQFVDWFTELDSKSLLDFALEETLKGKKLDGFSFAIEDGFVVSKTKYSGDAEKQKVEKVIDKIMNEFQMRTLKIVAELLEFETVISVNSGEVIIEGEKQNPDNNQVSRYLKITRRADGNSEIMFEHYSSKEALTEDRAKFTILAQKFGVPIDFTLSRPVGQPISTGVTHKDHLRH
ncbi:MAG: hypothetical protein HY226_01190 [Candidatus Vogelbacteria bacterium]|nr:hypothetical protein [Candidatus Vogelbacteria bacterium]